MVTGRIIERFELNDMIIEVVKSSTGYDVIYCTNKFLGVFMKNTTLTEAYAFIAGYMYKRAMLNS